MAGEMTANRTKQGVRNVALEKTASKQEEQRVAVAILRESFRENATEENFKRGSAKLSEEVKRSYVGRLVNCDEFEKNVVVE